MPAPPRPPGSRGGPRRRGEARGGRRRSGGDSRGGARGSPDPLAPARGCLLRARRCPLQAAGTHPAAPTHREPPGLPLEVAAVAVGPGRPAPGTRSRADRDGWRRRARIPPGPLERAAATANHPPAPRGAPAAQAPGPGAGSLGSRARPPRLPPAPSPARPARAPPAQPGKKPARRSPLGFPRGQSQVTYRSQFVPFGS